MTKLHDPDVCKFPEIRLMSEGTFYQQYDDVYHTLEPATFNHLMKCEILLDVLMKAGVHNWDGFEDAMLAYQEALK